MFTLYSADRCPFAARVRIALAEKGLQYDLVEIDLDDRPAWMYDKNPLGKVPVLEEDGFVLPESLVINEYLEERYPDPPLWPADAAERDHVAGRQRSVVLGNGEVLVDGAAAVVERVADDVAVLDADRERWHADR